MERVTRRARAAGLRQLADTVARMSATGATAHDLATVRYLATELARVLELPDFDDRPGLHAWCDSADAQLRIFETHGLAAWRRVRRGL